MGAGRAGGRDCFAGALKAVSHRHCGGAGIGHHHRHGKGRDASRALVLEHIGLGFVGDDAADSGSDEDAYAFGVGCELPCLCHSL